MKVKVTEIMKVEYVKVYDIDVGEYKEWLDGDEHTDNALLNFIYENDLYPDDSYECDSDSLDTWVSDSHELENTLKQ